MPKVQLFVITTNSHEYASSIDDVTEEGYEELIEFGRTIAEMSYISFNTESGGKAFIKGEFIESFIVEKEE